MPTYATSIYGRVAMCNFDAAAVGANFKSQRGFSGFVRNGVGDYTLTLESAQDQNMCVVTGGIQLGVVAAVQFYAEPVSSTTYRIRIFDGVGTFFDVDFWLVVDKINPN